MHGVAIEGNEHVLAGEDHLIDTIHGLKLKVSAASFMQTNPSQCARLYETLLEFAGLEGTELVYDLYTGMAPIAMLLRAQGGESYRNRKQPERCGGRP